MLGQVETEVECPFCGESFTLLVDPSQSHQSYVEDCFVCCRPIQFSVACEEDEVISVRAARE